MHFYKIFLCFLFLLKCSQWSALPELLFFKKKTSLLLSLTPCLSHILLVSSRTKSSSLTRDTDGCFPGPAYQVSPTTGEGQGFGVPIRATILLYLMESREELLNSLGLRSAPVKTGLPWGQERFVLTLVCDCRENLSKAEAHWEQPHLSSHPSCAL